MFQPVSCSIQWDTANAAKTMARCASIESRVRWQIGRDCRSCWTSGMRVLDAPEPVVAIDDEFWTDLVEVGGLALLIPTLGFSPCGGHRVRYLVSSDASRSSNSTELIIARGRMESASVIDSFDPV